MSTKRGDRHRRKRGQIEMRFRTWGGKRKGAGRKPKGARAGVAHCRRPVFKRLTPAHVTLRVADHVFNLRSKRSLRVIAKVLREGGLRSGVGIVEFCVQGNHLHLLVEAGSTEALSRAIQGFSVRLARGINVMMGRRGRVLGDRYHAHLLRTPTEVRHARHYIRNNHRHHAAQRGARLPSGWVDPFSSATPALAALLPAARTWLVREGWRRRPLV